MCKPYLERERNNYRKPLDVHVMVAVGLYGLGHGVKYKSLSKQFGLGASTCHKICIEFNRAIWSYKREVICWKSKEATLAFFKEKGFPGCLGAIDCCHIPILRPPNAGAAFLNHNGFSSIVLQGVVDENRRFCSVDIGNPGRNHDAKPISHRHSSGRQRGILA